jgi:hypothetical protein
MIGMLVVLPMAMAVDKDKVNPGALGFIVVALLGVATWLLIKSMNRHLRRVNIPPEPEDTAADGGPQLPDHPA